MSFQPQCRAWDAYDVYLFDIDGTLLSCTDAVHYFAFCEALTWIAGRSVTLDGVTTHGNTDVGILRDAFGIAGISEAEWRPKLTGIQQRMCSFVRLHMDDLRITVMPKVPEVLGYLHTKGALLGIATGNLEEIGQIKLEACGLRNQFDFGGYSDLFEYRRDVFRAAVLKAHVLASQSASICVVGDTPEDIRAARANSLDVIAVATGTYSFEALQIETPDWCLHSLAELPLRNMNLQPSTC